MSAYDKAKGLFDTLKKASEAQPCDIKKCDELLNQLKLLVFAGLQSGSLLSTGGGPDAAKEQTLTRDVLELACFLAFRRDEPDIKSFERHVAQLKMLYNDPSLKPSEQKHQILGLHLLHLLSGDRIAEFHTELELMSGNEYENQFVKLPIQLEVFLTEGNYAKMREEMKKMPPYCKTLNKQFDEMVRMKVGASLERSYENLPAQEAAKMLILNGIAELQEHAMKENERKAREENDDPMGDMTPSLTRRAPVGMVKWEVKDGRLYFTRSTEKKMEIPALDFMMNTIGYATDLERIV